MVGWGGATQYLNVLSLGDLASNTSETSANYLIGKWFLGTDLPMPISGGDSATGKVGAYSFSYASATGALFSNGVSASDVNQGSAGDCYLMAALGLIANAKSSYITNMFTENSNGTFGVGFYYNGTPVFTTVNKKLPITTSNKLAFGGGQSKSLSEELWVALAEKAYVQINAQATDGGNILDREVPGENSYQALEGGLASPIKQITNLNYRYYSSYYTGLGDAFAAGTFQSSNAETYKQTIIDALQGGAIGWMGSWGATTGSNGKKNFVAGHAFMLIVYNAATDKFIIRNPWGGDGSSNYNPQFEASITEFWNSNVKAVVALSDSSLADPVFEYSLASDASSQDAAIEEGGHVTITITRNTLGAMSTVYLSTSDGTAGSSDINALSKLAVTFAANESIKTVPIDIHTDGLTEGNESFVISLYKNHADVTPFDAATVYIKDASTATYDYSITASTLNATPVSEGDSIAFTITRNNTGTSSTVYVSTTAHTATSNDYAAINKQELTFAPNETIKTVTIKAYKDEITEGKEDFYLDLFKNFADINYSARSTGYIADSVADNFTYTLSSNASTEANAISEGGTITVNISRNTTGIASTVYLSTSNGTATSSDYIEVDKKEIIFGANQKTAQIEISTVSDWWLEGTEYVNVQLYKNLTDTAANKSTKAYIKDTSVSGYNYSVVSNTSESTAVVEGGSISFTITRDGKGSASTVYLNTLAGTASKEDYSEISMQAVTFGANETEKFVTVEVATDALAEGTEFFYLNLFRNYTDSSYTTYGAAYIKDAATNNDTYAVSSDASTSAKATSEGGAITFTVTRSSAGAVSTVYVSTVAGSASTSDFVEVDKQAITFAANETSKTVTVDTTTDPYTEGNEYFFLEVFKTYSDATTYNYTSYGTAYIKDFAVSNYSYKVTSSAGSSAKAISEGGSITFTMTRSSAGAISTIYVSTVAGTANSSDFEAIDKQAVTFAANETSKTLSVSTAADTYVEGNEYFFLEVFKTYADASADNYTSYGTAYIKDAAANNYTYSVTSDSGYTSPLTEGDKVTFTVTRSGSGTASTVYISTEEGTATTADYTDINKQALIFAANETVKTISVDTTTDSVTEGTDYFWLNVYKNYADSTWEYTSYGTAYIKDAAANDYTYSLSTSASSTPVAEGGDISFTVTRSGSGSVSTVYLSTIPGTAGSSDYSAITKQAVSFGANETTKTVTVSTLTDSLTTEGSEYFWLELYKNAADSEYDYASYTYAYIKDGTTNRDYTYQVTTAASTTPVAEGGEISFAITRSSSGSASTVYVSTIPGTAGSSDYSAFTKQAVSFGANETIKTVTVSTLTDSINAEGNEYFWLNLYKNAADSDYNYSSYAYAYIKDVVTAKYDYKITTSASNTPVAEGADISFTITRSGSGAASTVYVSTIPGTAGSSDYTAFTKKAVSFGANETTKTVTVSTLSDSLTTEGSEYFWLDLYKNAADSDYNYASYAYAYIKDGASNDYTYQISTSASGAPVTEGDEISFTITRSGSGAVSTVYVSTIPGTAGSSDFTAFTKKAVTFGANETTKTVTVSTLTDSLATEGDEYFWLNLYKHVADSDYSYSSYAYAYIKDVITENNDYDYAVTSNYNASGVIEGGNVTFTITRSGSGSASTVYVSTSPGTAGSADYNTFTKQAVTFGSNETVKTVTVSTLMDSLVTEGLEYFWLDLYKNAADSDGDYLSYGYAYISDKTTSSGMHLPELGSLPEKNNGIYLVEIIGIPPASHF